MDSNSGSCDANADQTRRGVIVAGPSTRADGGAVDQAVGPAASAVVDPKREHAYWRETYNERDYVEQGASFDDYGPAYSLGFNAHSIYAGRSFEALESELAIHWNVGRVTSSLSWDRARFAARDAWNRLSGGI